MRFTVLLQVVKGLPGFDAEETDLTPDQLRALLTSIKHYLWHGNTVVALEELDSLLLDLEGLEKPAKSVQRLLSLVQELHTYVSRNEGFIVNYGERHRHGEEISSAFVESTVNWVISKRFCKKQQMGWTVLGAHLLLQVRTQVLNEELENTFRTFFPKFRLPILQAS